MGSFDNYMVFVVCTMASIALATRDDDDDRPETENRSEQRYHNFFVQFAAREHQQFYDEMLALHNEVRAKHNAKPLNWNFSANTNTMNHLKSIIKGIIKPTHMSEFYKTYISKGTEHVTAKTIFDFWYSEGEGYDYNQKSENTNAEHFTQIVWKATRSVGFSFVYENGTNYFAAMYVPKGNIANSYATNVDRPKPEDDQLTILQC